MPWRAFAVASAAKPLEMIDCMSEPKQKITNDPAEIGKKVESGEAGNIT